MAMEEGRMGETSEAGPGSFEVCLTCGALVSDAIKHDAWHGASTSTEAEVEAGLRGSGV